MAGHDVARLAAVELAHGDHHGFKRGNIAADQDLKRRDHLGAHHHGIHALVRHGAMRRNAVDVDAEPIGIGHALPGRAGHGASGHLAPDMRAVNSVHALERAGLDHGKRADGDLLGGLEDDAHLARQRIGGIAQDAHGAEHHGHVRVMAARVHDARVLRGEGKARLLGDGQRVHVGAQGDATHRRPIGIVSAGRGTGDGCNDTVVVELSIRDAQLIELFAQQFLCIGLMTGHLGEAMEQAARGDDIGLRGGAQAANEIGGRSTRLRGLRGGVNGGKHGCSIGHDGPLSKECVLFWSASLPHAAPPARHARRHRREVTETAHENAERRAKASNEEPNRMTHGTARAPDPPTCRQRHGSRSVCPAPARPLPQAAPAQRATLSPVQLLQHGVDMLLGKLELAAFGQGVRHLNLVAQVVAQARRTLGHIDRGLVIDQVSVELAAQIGGAGIVAHLAAKPAHRKQ